jgi:hypothetical protein
MQYYIDGLFDSYLYNEDTCGYTDVRGFLDSDFHTVFPVEERR